jgi:hypothetical protein
MTVVLEKTNTDESNESDGSEDETDEDNSSQDESSKDESISKNHNITEIVNNTTQENLSESSSKKTTKILPIDIPKVNIQGVNSPTTSSFKKPTLKVDINALTPGKLTRKPSLEFGRSPSPTRLFGASPIMFIPWMQLGDSHKDHDNTHLGVSPPNHSQFPSRPESPVSPGQVCIHSSLYFCEKC